MASRAKRLGTRRRSTPTVFNHAGFRRLRPSGPAWQHERFDRLCCVCHTADRSGLSSEEDAVELTRLGARQPRLGKQFDHLICKISLLSWKRRRVAVVPAEPGTNVCVEPHLLARDFVGNPVELLHLLEQGLELIVVDGHVRSDASVRDEALAFQPLARFSGLAPITSTPARIVRCTSLRASPPCGTRATRIPGRRRPSPGGSWSSGSRPRSAIQPAASSLTHLHSAHRITMAREPTSQDRTRCHPCTRSARWGVGGARGGLAGRGRVPARKPAARRERGTIADFDGVRNMSERLTTCVVTYLDSSAAVRSSPSAVAFEARLRLSQSVCGVRVYRMREDSAGQGIGDWGNCNVVDRGCRRGAFPRLRMEDDAVAARATSSA